MEIATRSVITCPNCGATSAEEMPLDACLYFFECRHCGALLRPKAGDCCVFCSYGSVRCPPKQRLAIAAAGQSGDLDRAP